MFTIRQPHTVVLRRPVKSVDPSTNETKLEYASAVLRNVSCYVQFNSVTQMLELNGRQIELVGQLFTTDTNVLELDMITYDSKKFRIESVVKYNDYKGTFNHLIAEFSRMQAEE